MDLRLRPVTEASSITRVAPPLLLDPSLGDPVAQAARAASARGDVGGLVRALESVTDQTHLDFVLSVVPLEPAGLADALQSWMMDHPGDDVRVAAALGAAMVAEADMLGGGGADRDGSRRPDGFRTRLEAAERMLTGLVGEHPGTGAAWRLLLDIGRRLGRPQRDLAQLFAHADRAVPLFLPACRSYFQGIGAKAGGSAETSLDFARWVAARCPDGHPGPYLVALAHFDRSVASDGDAPSNDAVAEVRAMLDRTRLALDEWGNDPMGITAKNVFALTARRLNDHEVGAHMVRLIGSDGQRVTESPWNTFGDPGAVFANTGRFYRLW